MRNDSLARIIRHLVKFKQIVLKLLELKLDFISQSNTDLGLTRFRRGLQSSAGHTEAQITS